MTGNGKPEVERISLIDSLDGEWLKLPHAVMVDVGPATQTLAGLLKLTKRETFSAVESIAARSRLPIPTVRKHLRILNDNGWINHKGREKTRRGHLRRTATIAITKKTLTQLEPYGVLPWWACGHVRHVGRLSWSSKAVLAVVMGQLMKLKVAVEREDGDGDGEFADALETLGGDDRFGFSLTRLEMFTGLRRASIVAAKQDLHTLGIINWSGSSTGGGIDTIAPNWGFQAVVTPTTPGHVMVTFSGSSNLVNG